MCQSDDCSLAKRKCIPDIGRGGDVSAETGVTKPRNASCTTPFVATADQRPLPFTSTASSNDIGKQAPGRTPAEYPIEWALQDIWPTPSRRSTKKPLKIPRMHLNS